QAAVGVRQGHGALDVVGDGFGGCVGDVIHGQDDDVVAHAYAPIIAAVSPEGGRSIDDGHGGSYVGVSVYGANGRRGAYQRLVLMLCTWACWPALMGSTTLPMSMPYLNTVSPTAMSLRATLWPMGMSCSAFNWLLLSSSMIQAFTSVPAFRPSTTATATVSFASCNTACIIAVLSWCDDRPGCSIGVGWTHLR